MSSHEADNQSYDHLLKRLVEHQPAIVIPLLFPRVAAEVLEEINVEMLIPPRLLAPV